MRVLLGFFRRPVLNRPIEGTFLRSHGEAGINAGIQDKLVHFEEKPSNLHLKYSAGALPVVLRGKET